MPEIASAASPPCDSYEITVVDGRASDCSKEVVEEIRRDIANVRCLDNPAAIAPPVAMKIGIRNARGKVIRRADGRNLLKCQAVEIKGFLLGRKQ